MSSTSECICWQLPTWYFQNVESVILLPEGAVYPDLNVKEDGHHIITIGSKGSPYSLNSFVPSEIKVFIWSAKYLENLSDLVQITRKVSFIDSEWEGCRPLYLLSSALW